jgi:superfamily II DNA helicase RecQ
MLRERGVQVLKNGTKGSITARFYRKEFAIFSQLRQLRKELAEQEGIPVYAVFTNDHLADMVRQRIVSLAGLKGIDGIGQARLEKYGEAFLRILKRDIPGLSTGSISD